MTRKTLSLLALACAGALALPGTASACQTSAWLGTGAGTVVAGSPSDGTPTPRYSGKCAARANAPGSYVADDSPGAEPKYYVQFYVYTGITGGNDVRVFAADGAAPNVITVDYNQAGGFFKFGAGGTTKNVPANGIQANKWYMINLGWDKSTAQKMDIKVQGAGGAATTDSISPVNTGQVDTAKLGWIQGAATTSTPGIITDAFVSQRATPPLRLCRGDANADVVVGIQDRIAITTELLNQGGPNAATSLASGQPDCNEDGIVSIQDRICVTTRILAFDNCP